MTKPDSYTFQGVQTPIYIIEEEKLRRNLQLISDVAREADVEIILAFKAFALWKTFPIFREYIMPRQPARFSRRDWPTSSLALPPTPIRLPIPMVR